MSDDYDGIVIPRRTMTLFFIVDTSGSMFGEKIGAVNTAIREVIPEIRDMPENADAVIKIAVLDFSSGARWITPEPVEASLYQWRDVDAAGATDFGDACIKLKEQLSVSKGFMAEATGSYAPVLFLLSDGAPTDNWQKGLDELKNNNWYKASIKVAIAIGNDANEPENKAVLEAFTGNSEMVLEVHNAAALIKMIRFVSVSAAKVASGSDNAQTKQEAAVQVVKEIKEEVAASVNNSDPEW